jgi:glycosyltransferase involved in cell wall biosynthesis
MGSRVGRTYLMTPRVSIVLAVHNGQGTLAQALQSIAQQTFSEYEIIIINDGSDDTTAPLLLKWQQKWPSGQFTIIHQEVRRGLTSSLITGVLRSCGEYIARLDADDVWQEEKLERQVDFLSKNLDHGLVGSWYYNQTHTQRIKVRLPTADEQIRRFIWHNNPFGHSCILVRRSLILTAGNYDSTIRLGQDYDVWFRLLPLTKMANLPEFLVERHVSEGISQMNSTAQLQQSVRTIFKYARRYHTPWWRWGGVVWVGMIYLLSLIKRRFLK